MEKGDGVVSWSIHSVYITCQILFGCGGEIILKAEEEGEIDHNLGEKCNLIAAILHVIPREFD